MCGILQLSTKRKTAIFSSIIFEINNEKERKKSSMNYFITPYFKVYSYEFNILNNKVSMFVLKLVYITGISINRHFLMFSQKDLHSIIY